MLLISIRDNENSKWKRNAKKSKQKDKQRAKGNKSYSEKMRAKWFCCAFKLGFLQLICKASLILKSNLELALQLLKHVSEECRCLKIWDLLSFLICSSILVLKWWQVLPM